MAPSKRLKGTQPPPSIPLPVWGWCRARVLHGRQGAVIAVMRCASTSDEKRKLCGVLPSNVFFCKPQRAPPQATASGVLETQLANPRRLAGVHGACACMLQPPQCIRLALGWKHGGRQYEKTNFAATPVQSGVGGRPRAVRGRGRRPAAHGLAEEAPPAGGRRGARGNGVRRRLGQGSNCGLPPLSGVSAGFQAA
jgi:hypothetical protein